MKTGGTSTLHKKYKTNSLATQLERMKFNPSVPFFSFLPSLWIQTMEVGTNVLCVLCCTSVYRPISNANSWSYSLWLILKNEILHTGRGPRRNHPCKFWWRSVQGFLRDGGRISHFSIDLRCRPFTLALPCQRVIVMWPWICQLGVVTL